MRNRRCYVLSSTFVNKGVEGISLAGVVGRSLVCSCLLFRFFFGILLELTKSLDKKLRQKVDTQRNPTASVGMERQTHKSQKFCTSFEPFRSSRQNVILEF